MGFRSIVLSFTILTVLRAPSCFTHRGFFALSIKNKTNEEIRSGNIYFQCESDTIFNFRFSGVIKPDDKYELALPYSKDSVLNFIYDHKNCRKSDVRFTFIKNNVEFVKKISIQKFYKEGPVIIICN